MTPRKRLVLALIATLPAIAQSYKGPRPAKADVVYLVHASNLIPTEVSEAREDSKKNTVTYSVSGTSSPAKTPLAEPIFLIMTDRYALTPNGSNTVFCFEVY